MSIKLVRTEPKMAFPDLVYKEDGSAYLVLYTSGRYDKIYTREDMKLLIEEIQKTLDGLTDQEITEFNDFLKQESQEEQEKDKASTLNAVPERDKAIQGYVYILQGGEQYKIGCTTNPRARKRILAVHMPFEVHVYLLISTRDMYQTEQDLHQLFAAKRTHGEWFLLDENDLWFVRQTYSQHITYLAEEVPS